MEMIGDNLLKLLKKLDKTFTTITGQSISLMTKDGAYVLPLNYKFFTDFCIYVVKSEKGYEMCYKCNEESRRLKKNGITFEKCHMGLSIMQAPIYIDGQIYFTVTCGQVLFEEDKEIFFNNLKEKAEQIDLDYCQLLKKAKSLKVLSEAEVLSRGQFLLLLTEYISIAEAEFTARRKYREEVEANLTLENKLKNLEFRFLQSQISPHFLFNTLSLIAHIAKKEQAEQTTELIYALSDLLRWAFKSKESICPISDEIKCVTSYLEIQKTRLGDGLCYSIDIDRSAESCLIPVLSIQPFVENVIIHGMKEVQGSVCISISIKRERDRIFMDIKDTGTGIDSHTLTSIQNHTCLGKGIQNVEERLKLYFGKELFFEINSRASEGTHIQINWQIAENKGGLIND